MHDALLKTCLFLLLQFFFLTAAQALPNVKKSSSGICHSRESGWYERTKTYVTFDSVQDCLAAGGRLPKGLGRSTNVEYESSPSGSESPPGYSRELFGKGWADADNDCQDSRAEALIETSSTHVRFATSERCRVVTGRWISPFTGNVIQNSAEIDIDHVVPLRWAWDHGAASWTQERREEFANDPVNLWPVELGLNRSKGAKGPRDLHIGFRPLASASTS